MHEPEWHILARYCEQGGLRVEGDETRDELVEAVLYLVQSDAWQAAA